MQKERMQYRYSGEKDGDPVPNEREQYVGGSGLQRAMTDVTRTM